MNPDGGPGVVGPGAVDVVVVGDPGRTHGYLSRHLVAHAATAPRFDTGTDTWTATTTDGTPVTGRVLIDTTPSTSDAVVAAHGSPNRFRIPGPHTARQARYVAGLITALQRSGCTRIEARSRVRVHRLGPTRGLSRFYLAGSVVDTDTDTYDGPAELTHDGREHPARVRLAGHFDPIDGHYHWQGTLYADLP
ncbi:MAG TPA: DUF4873 domain-containing protein, partial [Mycobacterium sp.]|nr:DUF4873 domain-containing protein [Mycobacterium sp.]